MNPTKFEDAFQLYVDHRLRGEADEKERAFAAKAYYAGCLGASAVLANRISGLPKDSKILQRIVDLFDKANQELLTINHVVRETGGHA